MAVSSVERFTDNDGGEWKFVWIAHEGGLRLFLLEPSGREIELRSVPNTLPVTSPRCDADVALPMENL